MKLIQSLIILFVIQLLVGQEAQAFLPMSLNSEEGLSRARIVLPVVDVQELTEEDERMSFLKRKRFGFEHELNQNIFDYASVYSEGDMDIFLVEYLSYDAFALRAIFEPFYLPEGVNLFVYNSDMTQLEGAYTSINNNEANFFSTPLVEGERLTIEINVPRGIDLNDIELNISTLIHDYIGLQNIMNSQSDRACGANIMCEEADPYTDQINAAAWLDMGGYICSGAMINNMNQDLTPYFLTANHCTDGNNPQGYRFYFNYYVNGCATGQVIQGAYAYSSIMRSTCDCITGSGDNINIPGPDFTLLEITDAISDSWDVYYAGWNATNPNQMPLSVGVHHPGGDPKKINYDSGHATSAYWDGPEYHTHWYFNWDEGATEGGSSGSPVYDNLGRIAGMLTGGSGGCDDINTTEYYGKISRSWEWGETPSRRLKDWLDPENTGELLMDGTYEVYSEYTLGDVNDDGNINIQDIILLINFITGNLVANYPQDVASDMNEDGLINVQDIILVVSYIVNN